MPEIELKGISASEGIGIGILTIRKGNLDGVERIVGAPEEEGKLFAKATDDAAKAISELMARLDDTAAEIMEFQFELLGDEEFLAPVLEMIKGGKSAHQAWSEMIGSEIRDYQSAEDEYMSARADDLRDLKQRVLALILDVEAGGAKARNDKPHILAKKVLTPSEFLELDVTNLAAIAMLEGSPTSHVSILARARGIPMLVGCEEQLLKLDDGSEMIVDAFSGKLFCDPQKELLAHYHSEIQAMDALHKSAEAMVDEAARTANGETVLIYANVDDPDILDEVSVAPFDGVGLTRTELMFANGQPPNETEQYQAYKKILDWAEGRPVTIRTLDAGGDKPIAGFTQDGETNPFLGVRGYRLSRLNRKLFSVQLRALARAAVHGTLKVMIPMVTTPDEMSEFRSLMEAIVEELKAEDLECAIPALGMMIEVPVAAINAEAFDADFYSVGSNDLIQYATACARDNPALNDLARGDDPGVIKLISMAVDGAKHQNKELSLCGDMASVPSMIPVLLGAGVRTISVAIAQVALVKHAVRQWDGKMKEG